MKNGPKEQKRITPHMRFSLTDQSKKIHVSVDKSLDLRKKVSIKSNVNPKFIFELLNGINENISQLVVCSFTIFYKDEIVLHFSLRKTEYITAY